MIIFFNQVGYILNRAKTALATEGDSFALVDDVTNKVVLEKATEDCGYDPLSGHNLCLLDFSEISTEGIYYIKVGKVRTLSFPITTNPYTYVKKLMMKQFYFQRCGLELKEAYAGPYVHAACHTTKAVIVDESGNPTGKTQDVSGGWHDAGDYGKYTVAAATALGHMLYAYELFAPKLRDKLGNPPGMFKVSEFLTECRYELEWLLKMQARDPANRGGFYHKVTTKVFCGMVMPEHDEEELLLYPVSSGATAYACAALFAGMRAFKKIDIKFARRLRDSAELAWRWLSNNGEVTFVNPQGTNTGEYGECEDTDARFWAAIEMYRLTKQDKFLEYARTLLTSIDPVGFGWKKTAGFGSLSYLISIGFNTNDRLGSKLAECFIEAADRLVETAKSNAFGITLKAKEFEWGSNMAVMCNAIVLLTAFQVSADQRRSIDYEGVALNQLNYLLGRNPTGYCFVSGCSPKSINYPHNRPSTADNIKQCIPGIVSGGPNVYFEDECIREVLKPGVPPARCFVDDYRSYSTNENAIYWNSCAVFVAAYFD